jgi:hypothetical protein
MLLPAGGLHDGRDGRTLPALQHGDYCRLLRLGASRVGGLARSFADSFAIRTSATRVQLRPAPHTLPRLLRRGRFVGLRVSPVLAGADRGEATLGDAQRERSFIVVAPPNRQCARRRNFFNQVLAQ